MSKILETEVTEQIAEEIDAVIIEDRFLDESDFVRHCIRAYLNKRKKKIKKSETKLEDNSANINTLSQEQKKQIRMIREIIKVVQDEHKGGVSKEEIIIRAEDAGVKKETVEDMIQQLKRTGEIYETSNDKFRVV